VSLVFVANAAAGDEGLVRISSGGTFDASRLRRKLNAAGETAYVLNVWGVGCRLVATTG
jgi:hypothetical protein